VRPVSPLWPLSVEEHPEVLCCCGRSLEVVCLFCLPSAAAADAAELLCISVGFFLGFFGICFLWWKWKGWVFLGRNEGRSRGLWDFE
jgi:hypothetical protein